jgi:hypothetical protein
MAEQILKKLQMPDGNTYVFNASQLEGKTLEEIKALIIQEAQVETVQYLGLVSALNGLSTTAGYGDFHRVSGGFTDSASGKSVHAGDLLVAAKANPAQNLNEENWVIVHGEEGNLITHKHNVTIEGQTLYNEAHNHTFSGTEATLNYTPAGTLTISKGTGTANYTPEGTITLSGDTAAASKTSDVASTEHTHSVSASGTYKPEGTINGTFSGSTSITEEASETASVASDVHTHVVKISEGTGTANYTPKGSVSQPTFTGTEVSLEHTFVGTKETITGTFGGTSATTGAVKSETGFVADVAAQGHTHSVTGTISQPTFSGDKKTISVSGTSGNNSASEDVMNSVVTYSSDTQTLVFGKVAVANGTHTHSVSASGDYTPTGTVSRPTFSEGSAAATTTAKVSAATSTHKHDVTAAGNVSFEYTPKGTIAAHTYAPSGTVSKPTFSGTGVELKATSEGPSDTKAVASSTHKHNVTASGKLEGLSFSGKEVTISVNGTAAKSTSAAATVASSDHTHGVGTLGAVFAGTGVELKGTFKGTQGTITYTPAGTISSTTIKVDLAEEVISTSDPL